MSIQEIELDLAAIRDKGRLREKENIRFRVLLKSKDSGKVDRLVHQINAEVSSRIDCTKCANCCKQLKPELNNSDIKRIAGRLDISKEAMKETYTETSEGEIFFKNSPCSFLCENKCTIYEDRLRSCSEYSFLHKSDFNLRLTFCLQPFWGNHDW